MTALPLLSYNGSGYISHPSDTLLRVDLPTLMATRMLATATSGGGKSTALRQLLEQTYGKVPHIVIDPEGEFATLREKFDYVVLARSGGDLVPDVKTARLMCRKTVETGASVIIDLSEVSPAERREFVRVFLNALVSLPRSLWRDYLVVLDEGQLFAPEKGESVATDEVIAVSTLGRKRGFCLIVGTLRISQFNKDAAATLLNRMIGLAGLDVDVKRAGDELGFDAKERRSLMTLDPGQFYAFGPAISKTVQLVRTEKHLKTAPPPRGVHASSIVAPPSRKVVALIEASFAELPKEAAEEATSIESLRKENAALKKQLAGGHPRVAIDQGAIDRAVAEEHARYRKLLEAARGMSRTLLLCNESRDVFVRTIGEIGESRIARLEGREAKAARDTPTHEVVRSATNDGGEVAWSIPRPTKPVASLVDRDLSAGEQRVLDAVAELRAIGIRQPTRDQVGVFADYDLGGGRPAGYVSRLTRDEYLAIPVIGSLELTPKGDAAANEPAKPRSLSDLHERALARLSDGEAKILRYLLAIHPGSESRAQVGEAVGYSLGGGRPAGYVAKLTTMGFAEIPRNGDLKAGALLFPEGLT